MEAFEGSPRGENNAYPTKDREKRRRSRPQIVKVAPALPELECPTSESDGERRLDRLASVQLQNEPLCKDL